MSQETWTHKDIANPHEWPHYVTRLLYAAPQPTKREPLIQAAKQALEVLESLHGGCTDSDDGTVEAITVHCPEVIDALRLALGGEA